MKRIILIATFLLSFTCIKAQIAAPSPDFLGTFPQFYSDLDTFWNANNDSNIAKMAENWYVDGTKKTLTCTSWGYELKHVNGATTNDTGKIYLYGKINETYGGWYVLDSTVIETDLTHQHFILGLTNNKTAMAHNSYTSYLIVTKITNVRADTVSGRAILLLR